ncbi:uncharacterized protein LOC123519746 [Portunus trituberculatus]|uniref:uncharacterized protein LOC123519746 n=1 Tax=Portunus trituberculatus TaxID=210409 RepID=UPI001E1CF19A|nr:uncharacterized protein LOC123519746 [Portunus trituberculatus]
MASVHREHWSLALPLVLLSIRSSLKEDLQHSPAELVYGTSLRLPGKIMAPTPASPPSSTQDFASHLKSAMSHLQPVPPRSLPRKPSSARTLLTACTCSFMWMLYTLLSCNPTKAPTVSCDAHEKVTIDRNGSLDSVSIDRVKPAHLLEPTNTAVLAATMTPDSKATTQRICFSLPRH